MAIVVLLILGGSFALFVSGRVRPDLIALMVLVSLVLSGAIAPAEVFLGFSSNAVITIAGLMIIGEGMVRTGVVKWVARKLEKVIRRKYGRLLFLNTAIPGLLSGFINIVAAASFFIPVILRLSKQMEVPQSKVLLPMACTALIGANLTLIGASHNLVVHSLLEAENGEGFGFFTFTPVGAALLVAALIYVFLSQRLLPGEREAPAPEETPKTANLVEVFELEERLFEVYLAEQRPGDATLTLEDLEIEGHGLTLLALVRDGEQLQFPARDTPLEAGDLLLVQGREEVVHELTEGHDRLTGLGPPHSQTKYPISTADLAEAVVPPRSPALGRPVSELELLTTYGVTPIAVFRRGEPRRTEVGAIELEEGDSILVYGPREKMREFDPERELLIYFRPGEPAVSSRRKKLAPVAVAILVAVIAVAAAGVFPIAVTAVAGALAMVLLGMVQGEKMYDAIDWRTLVLIGGMYPLGVALEGTGAADLIGEALTATLGGLGPIAVLAGVVVLCMVLTQAMHNAAVAVIMAPIAINAAKAMDSSPTGFCVGVVVACSTTFLMPYGHPAPLLVQEPGGYRTADYLRFGVTLNVLALAAILGLVPLLWSL